MSKAKPKTPAKKTTTAKAKPKTTAAKAKPATRRPDPNLPPSVNMINSLTQDVLYLITQLSDYAANLRALDRQRHNGVGLRRLGFIEAAVGLRPLCGFAPAHFYVPFVKNYCGNY